MLASKLLDISRLRTHLYVGLLLFFLLFSGALKAQSVDQVKIMSYNLLNYPDMGSFTADTSLRNPEYRTTMAAAQPDILVIQELSTQIGLDGFLANVMNKAGSGYAAGTFIDGPDSNNGILYKSTKFHFISNTPIKTDLRDITEFKLVHIASGDTLRIYSVHLKASAGSVYEAQRALEIDSLRKVTDALPAGANFIICGDFNFYGSNESAYQKLLQPHAGTQGEFVDAISMTGTWNNPAYSAYHTQSPRLRAFNGGSTGGMDDRFDLMLYSKGIDAAGGMQYVAGTMKAFGNDGNHYNDSINHMPNTAVTQAVANALHNGSDHLPVIATFSFTYGALDVGVANFIAPTLGSCNNPDKTMQVVVKNFGAITADFGFSPVTVKLKAVSPSGTVTVQTKALVTGTLASNASQTITFDNTYNMGNAGNYTFRAWTETSGDVNTANDSLATVTLSVSSNVQASVSPSGTVALCGGTAQILSASQGTTYAWSNGATTSTIGVTDTGYYSVTVTDQYGCSATSDAVHVVTGTTGTVRVFHEDMGTAPSTILIPAHESANGFESVALTMSGSGDVRNTSTSSGYAGASGLGNVYLTSTAGKNFIIAGINTSGMTALQLSFGVSKSSTTSTGSELLVQVSTNGTTYTNLTMAALPIGTGTTSWYLRTITTGIPAAPQLWIRFQQNSSSGVSFRIDDVELRATGSATITPSGPLSILQGDSVTLTANSGTYYLWNTGATSQSIRVKSSGTYTVTVDCINSEPVDVSVTSSSVTLNLGILVQGFYTSNGLLNAVLYDQGLSTDPTACDSISISLHAATSPYDEVAVCNTILHTDGSVAANFSAALAGQSYYVVIRHRNSIETWSKLPVVLGGGTTSISFKN